MDKIYFPDQIQGFSRVEYLSVLIALLYAFVIAEFFMGWGKMLRQRESIKFSFQHLLWTAIFFWGFLLNWYILWIRIEFLAHGFLYFIFILLPIMIAFLGTVFLFPDLDRVQDMKSYYDKHQSLIILLFSFALLFNTLIGIYFHETNVYSIVNLLRLSVSILSIAAVLLNIKPIKDILVYIFTASIIAGTFVISIM